MSCEELWGIGDATGKRTVHFEAPPELPSGRIDLGYLAAVARI